MRRWEDAEICAGLRDPALREQAFRALHAQYGPRLLGLLARMSGGDRDRAEDLLGRALYKAYGGLVRMREPCRSLGGWLYTVAARTALDDLARTASDDPLDEALPLEDERLRTPDAVPASGAEGPVDDAVEAALAELEREDPRYRALLEMEHVGACDRGEIADATGIPRKQIAQYLKRARSRFVRIARRYPALAGLADEPREGTGR